VNSWREFIDLELRKPYMHEVFSFLEKELSLGKIIYPEIENLFKAFDLCTLDNTKVVILGQDPYYGPNEANGMAFSVQPGQLIPPSLKNIFIEIKNDLGIPVPENGDLTHWAQQGVLLLNTTLTVQQGKPGSHMGKGWETFTDEVVKLLTNKEQPPVFVLLGARALKKSKLLKEDSYLYSRHPSPQSVNKGFFGSRLFSQINDTLKQRGMSPIDWSVK
jgi:uracil-DNA glycosylase